MRKLFFSAFLNMILFLYSGAVTSQQIHNNVYLNYIDEPVEYNKTLISAGYHEIDHYSCQDSVFNKASCPCTYKKIFNDSGRLIKMILGDDIDKGLVNYIINYKSLNDSHAIVNTEYKSHFLDSIHNPFAIYEREKDSSLVVHSFLKFDGPEDRDLPDTVYRYDRNQKLREIYYPKGNRKPIRTWSDTLNSPDRCEITSHFIFKENEFHSYAIYNSKELTLETGSSNINTGDTINQNEDHCFYVYDDSSRLIFRHTVGRNNIFRSDETYVYKNNKLAKYTKKYNLHDSLDNILKLYNDQGQLIFYQERAEGYPYDLWQYFYTFKNGLLVKTIYYRNKVCKGASFCILK